MVEGRETNKKDGNKNRRKKKEIFFFCLSMHRMLRGTKTPILSSCLITFSSPPFPLLQNQNGLSYLRSEIQRFTPCIVDSRGIFNQPDSRDEFDTQMGGLSPVIQKQDTENSRGELNYCSLSIQNTVEKQIRTIFFLSKNKFENFFDIFFQLLTRG